MRLFNHTQEIVKQIVDTFYFLKLFEFKISFNLNFKSLFEIDFLAN